MTGKEVGCKRVVVEPVVGSSQSFGPDHGTDGTQDVVILLGSWLGLTVGLKTVVQ